jgi:UDP:flavonoid glycosyltransferase YjiC (YdhE family)
MWAPAWLKQFQYWAGEKVLLDPHIVPKLNVVRAELGLPPRRKTTRWWHSPQCILGLFPEWYAPRQPDWPANVHLTQFPLWNERSDEPLSRAVAEFLAAGEPPIAFTPGSGNMFGTEFFRAAADACVSLDRRGMLFTRFSQQIPASLPPNVRHFEYAPFQQVLPRCCAISHHGGIGTTAQAMAAGIPQLIMPLSHDQPDNAHRVRRLHVGDLLAPANYRGPAVTEKLRTLLDDPAVTQACAEVQARYAGVDPYAQACDVLESMIGQDQRLS